MSKYQKHIIELLKSGAQLHCTEGVNYKCWVILSDGTEVNVRRDSAEKICREYQDKLVFGDIKCGIYWGGVKFNNNICVPR